MADICFGIVKEEHIKVTHSVFVGIQKCDGVCIYRHFILWRFRLMLSLCLLLFFSSSLFARNEMGNESEDLIATLHFGIGSEFNTNGLGLSLANSVVAKYGAFGFGAFWGIGWGIFSDPPPLGLPMSWDVYLSYEYPKWFGGFFSYGINYDLEYPYTYSSYTQGESQVTVDRSFAIVGLQKTFYLSGSSSEGAVVPGTYGGGVYIPAQYIPAGSYHATINLQIGVKIDGIGEITSYGWSSPMNEKELIPSISADDNKIGFFIGVKVNGDIPIRIRHK
jgi:hypothetical protein